MLLYVFILQKLCTFCSFISTLKAYLCPAGAEVQKLWSSFSLKASRSMCAKKMRGFLLFLFQPPPVSYPSSTSFFLKNNHEHVVCLFVCLFWGFFFGHIFVNILSGILAWDFKHPDILIGENWVFLLKINSLKRDLNSFDL